MTTKLTDPFCPQCDPSQLSVNDDNLHCPLPKCNSKNYQWQEYTKIISLIYVQYHKYPGHLYSFVLTMVNTVWFWILKGCSLSSPRAYFEWLISDMQTWASTHSPQQLRPDLNRLFYCRWVFIFMIDSVYSSIYVFLIFEYFLMSYLPSKLLVYNDLEHKASSRSVASWRVLCIIGEKQSK